MRRTTPVVQAAYPNGVGGWILLIDRPLGWDAPWFRSSLTGRATPVRVFRPGRRDRRIHVLPRPGPGRRPQAPQAP